MKKWTFALVLILLLLFITACKKQATVPQRLDRDSLHLAWTYDTNNPINHPPLRVGDIVVIVSGDGPLLGLDIKTGQVKWQYAPATEKRIWDRAFASNGELVFVGIEGGQVIALDGESGQVRWEQNLGIDMQHPPLIADDILYVPTTFVGTGLANDPNGKAKLFALAVADGGQLWSYESNNYILQTPYRYADRLYVAGLFHDPDPVSEGGHTRLSALSAETGTLIWTYKSQDGFPKRVYATATAVTFIGYQDFANGLDATTGELLWRRDTGNWVPSLAGVDDVIYFGSANTIVHALNVNDGAVTWQHNIKEGTFNYMLGAPISVEDDLYFLTQHGDIVALNRQDGTLLWDFATGVTARVGLTVAGDWILIGDELGRVYAYNAR